MLPFEFFALNWEHHIIVDADFRRPALVSQWLDGWFGWLFEEVAFEQRSHFFVLRPLTHIMTIVLHISSLSSNNYFNSGRVEKIYVLFQRTRGNRGGWKGGSMVKVVTWYNFETQRDG